VTVTDTQPIEIVDAPDGESTPPPPEETEVRPERLGPDALPIRLAVALAFPVVGAAVMVGGIFSGASPRIYDAVAGLLGVALGVGVSRVRRTSSALLLVVVGVFAIGAFMLFPHVGDILRVHRLASSAAKNSHILRPPVSFDPGWKAISGWLLATVGFGAAWMAIAVRRPALGLLVPLPICAIAGISVPKGAQVGSGIAVLVLLAIGLGLLSSEQATGEDDTPPPLAYEIRKALKALPLIAVITVALFFLSKSNFLFPEPQINPAQKPQRPKTQPLAHVPDRVLFTVKSTLTGPWRVGSLDVYDGTDWRLPPFAENRLSPVGRSGIVNSHLSQEVSAQITIKGLSGTVLPDLPNTVAVSASGPKLAYDSRSGNLRLVESQVKAGYSYLINAAGLPTVDNLRVEGKSVPKDIKDCCTFIPKPPPAVQGLLDQAPTSNLWDKFDYLRNYVLDNVTATGTGQPVPVTPERVQDMLAGSKEGSPFEIVAAEAMIARWAGLPSRIGYGFDGGDRVASDTLEVHPTHGAAFVEVYFPSFEWLPVIGTPRKAKPTVGGDPSTQRITDQVQPSDDVAVQVFVPLFVPPGSVLGKQIVRDAEIVLPALLLLWLLYVLYPGIRKVQLRSRRREAAAGAGTRARVALAYAEFRDFATDFGFNYPTDTPLMFLDRFAEDEEHTELAWLTTRVLWGDLQFDENPAQATVAEELSRALRRRLSAAQPASMRAVAALSRLSMREPYAPETDLSQAKTKNARKEADREPVSV
jgi:hypothetical protein